MRKSERTGTDKRAKTFRDWEDRETANGEYFEKRGVIWTEQKIQTQGAEMESQDPEAQQLLCQLISHPHLFSFDWEFLHNHITFY